MVVCLHVHYCAADGWSGISSYNLTSGKWAKCDLKHRNLDAACHHVLYRVLAVCLLLYEQVQIIGHQPPSSGMKGYSWAYHKIVNRYASTVIAQIFGHAHVDKVMTSNYALDRGLPTILRTGTTFFHYWQ